MKFGGTSVADAERMRAVAEIIAAHVDRRPVVVVSALAGVTDRLSRAVEAARRGAFEELDAELAEVERRHRWATSGSIEDASLRYHTHLEIDRGFEQVRQQTRSIRILRESTPRTADALLALGELLSSRILAAVLEDRGLRSRWIDPRSVVPTDGEFGTAEPDFQGVRERGRAVLAPLLDAGHVPVVGGFVGATRTGETTTLGRGGSDTTAAILGAALEAEEIQIWTDVDGMMSADPRIVPDARRLPRVTFVEAAELAYHGARVLHPPSIEPAVRRGVSVRVLNSLNPQCGGTWVVETADRAETQGVAAVASRSGAAILRVSHANLRHDPDLAGEVTRALARRAVLPRLSVATETGVCFVIPEGPELGALEEELGSERRVGLIPARAVLNVVGSGIAGDTAARGRILEELGRWSPDLIVLGTSGASVTAVLGARDLAQAVQALHRRFFSGR